MRFTKKKGIGYWGLIFFTNKWLIVIWEINFVNPFFCGKKRGLQKNNKQNHKDIQITNNR